MKYFEKIFSLPRWYDSMSYYLKNNSQLFSNIRKSLSHKGIIQLCIRQKLLY